MSTFPEVCPTCAGSGHTPDPNNAAGLVVCSACNGTGIIQVQVDS